MLYLLSKNLFGRSKYHPSLVEQKIHVRGADCSALGIQIQPVNPFLEVVLAKRDSTSDGLERVEPPWNFGGSIYYILMLMMFFLARLYFENCT